MDAALAETRYRIAEPFPEGQLLRFWNWYQENKSAMVDDNAPQTMDALRDKFRSDTHNGGKSYAIYLDQVPVGAVWGEHIGDQMFLGHLVFERDALTPAEKSAATKECLARMCATGCRKIVWQLYQDNRAFSIFLRRMGARLEGCLKEGTRRNGTLCDLVLMASFPKDFS